MIRLGLVGAGGYGRLHVDGFLSLQAEGLVQIVSLADPSPVVLTELQALPELRKARCFTDYRDLLAAGEIDAVVISAPIPLHYEIALAALERGLFILLEKPPVPLLSQLGELIAADGDHRVMVGFQHIYSDLIHDLKQELVAGRAGKLLSISAHGLWPRDTAYYMRAGWAGQIEWRGQPVLDGPCTNACAHYINIALYLAGDNSDTFAMPSQVTGEVYRARPGLPGYDTGCLSGVFDSNSYFFFGFSHASSGYSPVQIRVRGEKETLSLLDDGETLLPGEGLPTRGNDGRESMRRAFLAFAGGDRSRNKTPLHATRAYVLATNLMFLSSGGIHTIPGEYVSEKNSGTDNAFFEVENLASLLEQSASNLQPLCGTPAPWATKSLPIASSNFSEEGLVHALRMSTTRIRGNPLRATG